MKWIHSCISLVIIGVFSGQAVGEAVDFEIAEGERSIYVLLDDGTIQFSGSAVNRGFPQNADAVDLTLTHSGMGYYVVEEDGTVHSFGDAIVFGHPVSSRQDVVDMELTANSGFYFLREDGTIVTVGDAKLRGFLEKDGAVDMELTDDDEGYTVLYEDGSMAFFGTAVNHGFETFRTDEVVDFEPVDEGYYVFKEDGIVLNFGKALPLPSKADLSGDFVDIAITDRGYRTLDEDGNIEAFMRLENQGTISWFAKSKVSLPQQAPTATPTPAATATPTPRPTATPRPSEPILEIEESGFDAEVIAVFPQNVNAPIGMNTGQVSLTTGDTFIVTAGENGAARSIRLYRQEDFGRLNNDGDLFVQLNPDRGAAVIKGISYSQLGLIVTIEDVTGTQLLLIDGPFSDASINGFAEF